MGERGVRSGRSVIFGGTILSSTGLDLRASVEAMPTTSLVGCGVRSIMVCYVVGCGSGRLNSTHLATVGRFT